MRINHNIAALNTYRQLSNNNIGANKALEKLSSGLRINRAGDDAAGLAISEKMRGQIRGLEMASKNAQDGISLIQTAEGALNEVHSILQRMRELSVQASNDTNTSDDRAELQKEIDQLIEEIDRIATTTEFNTKKLLNGEVGSKVDVTGTNASKVLNTYVSGTVQDASYNFEVTQAGQEQILTTQGGATNTDTDSSAAGNATLNLTDTLATIFGDDDAATAQGTLTGDEKLIFSQDGKSITISLATTDKIGDVINKINAAAEDAGMTMTASWDSANSAIKVNAGGVGSKYAVTVSELNFEGNATFGFNTSGTGGQAAADYTFTITNTTSNIQVTGVTISSLEGTINNSTVGIEGLDIKVDATLADINAVNFSLDIQSDKVTMHIGANKDQTMDIAINDMGAKALGVDNIDVTSQTGAESAIDALDTALSRVSSERAKLGAYQNRLEHTINNLGTSAENLTAAESRIRDVDMAKEMMEFTKQNILTQAAQAMLAQANQQPQGVLQLLR